MPARIGLLALVALLAAFLRTPSAASTLDGRSTLGRPDGRSTLARFEAGHGERAVTTARGSHPSERGAAAAGSGDAGAPPPGSPRATLRRAPHPPFVACEAPAPHATGLFDARRLVRAARPRSHVPRMSDEPPRA